MTWNPQDESSTYDQRRFYTASQNADGHSEQRSVRYPPQLLRAAHVAVSLGLIPSYQTVSDLMRDALAHRLHYVNNEVLASAEVDEVLRGMRIIQDRIDREERLANLHKHIRDMEGVVTKYGVEGQEEAAEFLRNTLRDVGGMPKFWREMYTREIMRRWEYLLEEKE